MPQCKAVNSSNIVPVQNRLAFELLFTAKVNQLKAYRRVPVLLELPDCDPLSDRWLEAAAAIAYHQPLEIFGKMWQWNFIDGLKITEPQTKQSKYEPDQLWWE